MSTSIDLGEAGTVEVLHRVETTTGAFEYAVELNGVKGYVVIVERAGVPTRGPSREGWHEAGTPTLSYEQVDAIAAAIIERDWTIYPSGNANP
jgi:hypothetical protein